LGTHALSNGQWNQWIPALRRFHGGGRQCRIYAVTTSRPKICDDCRANASNDTELVTLCPLRRTSDAIEFLGLNPATELWRRRGGGAGD
jgi:hypothetical protein